MKHLLTISLFSLAIGGVWTSCDKLSDNGDLDGMWQLREMHTKASADEETYSQAADKRAEKIFWSFQLDLLSITSEASLNGYTGETVARFSYSGERLEITQTYIHYRDRDSLLTDPATTELQALGIRGNSASFAVRQLSKHSLILCSATDSLVFKKI